MAIGFTDTADGAISDDTEFRDWGSAFNGLLDSIGWVQTADTGQIDWGTVTKPAQGTAAGYEIWRLDDALQATAPIFLKIEFGARSDGGWALWITIGTGSNGSGSLTGTTWTSGEQYGDGDSGSKTMYVSGDEGRIAALLPRGQHDGMMFILERLRDETGEVAGDAVYCFIGAPGWSSPKAVVYPTSGYEARFNYSNAKLYCLMNSGGNNSHSHDSKTGVFPLTPPYDWPGLGLLGVVCHYATDFSDLEEFTVERFGTDYTYKTMGNGTSPTNNTPNSLVLHGPSWAVPALLWDDGGSTDDGYAGEIEEGFSGGGGGGGDPVVPEVGQLWPRTQ